jgi:hypothetical protein
MMRNSLFKIVAVIFTGALLLTISCSQEACFDETNAYLKTSFYLNSSQKPLAPDSLTLYGIGRDISKIYNKSTSVKTALLPLNSLTISCGFIVRINGVSDTLTIWYSSYPHLLSQACGYTFYHTLDSVAVTQNIIDKATVLSNSVTTLNEENIRIYY